MEHELVFDHRDESRQRSAVLHDEVLRDARSRKIDLIVATGAFAEAARAAHQTDARLIVADDWQSAYPRLRGRLHGNEVVLLKASRGIRLEGILPLLEEDFGARDAAARLEAERVRRAVEA